MGPRIQSRRERLRAETTAEIKRVALKHVTTSGPDAISLRAIARDMGMTANAIYSYFPTRDDLVSNLIDDLYTSLVDALEAARDRDPGAAPGGRLEAWTREFRDWSLGNPCGFRLIYGDPVPGYHPESRPAAEAELRACLGITGLVAAVWSQAAPLQADDGYAWSDFDTELVTVVRRQHPDLPPAGLALALRIWARMHGLVSLEIYGHLSVQTQRVDKIYTAEMRDLLRSVGLHSSG